MPANLSKNNNSAPAPVKSAAVMEAVNKYFNIAYPILLAVVLLLGVINLYGYYQNQIEQITVNLQNNRGELAQKQADLKDVEQLRLDYERLGGGVQQLFDALPDKADLPDLYMQLQGAVKKNNLKILSFNVAESAVNPETTLHSVDINMNIGGDLTVDYTNFKQLLNDLELSLRVLSVTAINYDPRAKSFSLILQTFYLEEG